MFETDKERQRANYNFCETVTIDDILYQRNYSVKTLSTPHSWPDPRSVISLSITSMNTEVQ